MSATQKRNSKQKNAIKDKLVKRYGNQCHYCKDTLRRGGPLSGKLMTIEHIVPLVMGGTWALTNLVLACYDCNHKRKHTYVVCECDTCSSARWRHEFYA